MTTRAQIMRYLGWVVVMTLVSACGKSVEQVHSANDLNVDEENFLLTTPVDKTPRHQPPAAQVPTVVPRANPPTTTGAASKPARRSEHNEGSPDGRLKREDIAESGFIKPTVYFYPRYDEDAARCKDNEKIGLFDDSGHRMFKVCPRTHFGCAIQGSCSVTLDGVEHALNIITRIGKQDRYFEIPDDGCKYGYGVQQSCLDPFHTLAADLRHYNPGDVIYVPAVVGLDLPGGHKHDGFFVIRDRGRGIKGIGRFDFFSGYFSWRDGENPFNKIGLSDVHTNVPYFKVKGSKADHVRQARNYPKLPGATRVSSH